MSTDSSIPCPLHVLPKDVREMVDQVAKLNTGDRHQAAMALYSLAARTIRTTNAIGVPMDWSLVLLSREDFRDVMRASLFLHVMRTMNAHPGHVDLWMDPDTSEDGLALFEWLQSQGITVSQWLDRLSEPRS